MREFLRMAKLDKCLLIIVVVIIFLSPYISPGGCQQGVWKKLNRTPRCIRAKGDHYSSLQYQGPSKFLAAIKFVFLNGQIRCFSSNVFNSNWGCIKGGASLNMFFTDWKNHVIFPKSRHVTFSGKGKWYSLPGFDEISPELVMSDFANPFYLYSNLRMRIWYGEDLFDVSESDNYGKVCMDVYGYLV